MKILACYKWTLDEQDIKINSENQSLDTSRAKYKISEYDKNAIEEATLLMESAGANTDVLTFGGAAVKQSFKDVLSRGPEQAFYIADEAADSADAFVTANVLAAVIRKNGPYDLILCGEGSSDVYNQQVAPRLGSLLGLPTVTYVQKLELQGNRVVATRKLADCTEVATVEGPAVISVLPEINKPRIPSLKQVLGAAKKPATEIKLADLGLSAAELSPKTTRKALKGFVMNRKNVVYKETDQAVNVAKLVASLAAEGLA
jgi:electron transfer flavoprotein beta subunit